MLAVLQDQIQKDLPHLKNPPRSTTRTERTYSTDSVSQSPDAPGSSASTGTWRAPFSVQTA